MFQALIHIVETQEDQELCCLSLRPSSHPLCSNKVRKSESQHSEEEMTIYLDCPSNKSLKKTEYNSLNQEKVQKSIMWFNGVSIIFNGSGQIPITDNNQGQLLLFLM